VTVVTDDGPLPIEAISQGMTSLIGWVGILLQRLYEVYEDSDDPAQSYALVLIDEIDAHLHPAWQRTLVKKLSGVFPNVQFIATTHSPLIVAGMPVSQIIRLERDIDGQVERVAVGQEQTMGRADQILRGDLFGLETTLGTATEDKKKRYETLLGSSARSDSEDQEFHTLNRELRSDLRLVETNRSLIQTQAVLLESLSAQIKEESPEGSEALNISAKELRADLDRIPSS
jgi:predicted ATP-binding protein involved in virulence